MNFSSKSSLAVELIRYCFFVLISCMYCFLFCFSICSDLVSSTIYLLGLDLQFGIDMTIFERSFVAFFDCSILLNTNYQKYDGN